MKTIAIAAHKGGVGKTTTAVNLGAALAERGAEVLIVDLDQQASTSLSLGLERAELRPSLADVVYGDQEASEVVRSLPWDGLSLITASDELASWDVRDTPPQRLAQALEDGGLEAFDVVLLDCPPARSRLTVSALVASDTYLVPTRPAYLEIAGVGGVLETARDVAEKTGTPLPLLGVLLTQVDRRTRQAEEYDEDLRENLGAQVLETSIPIHVDISYAASHGEPVLAHAPSSKGAEAYRALGEEVENRLQQQEAGNDG